MQFSEKINYREGQALFTAVIFFLFISSAAVLSLATSSVKNSKISLDLLNSKKSYFLTEASGEDVVYRILKGKNYSSQEVLGLDGFFATTTIISNGQEQNIESQGNVINNIRKIKIGLTPGTGQVGFHYGVQVGSGGVEMENSSSVSGNIYANGPIQGAGSNLISGDAVSAAASGSISGVHATSSAYAHFISNSLIDKDAYYQTISGTIVGGILHPNSPDQPFRDMPISDDIIDGWEAAAASSTIINSPCPYIIDDDAELGPVKINCDLTIKGSPTITLNGTIWVKGNITIENTATIRINSALGKKSIAFIADNPANRLTSSKITLQNSATFQNSGTKGSYILFISRNTSAESGGEESCIVIENSASGDVLLYGPHCEILLKNSISLREVTAYKVHLQNTANVIYESGLASLLFETGPSGSYSINSWREIK